MVKSSSKILLHLCVWHKQKWWVTLLHWKVLQRIVIGKHTIINCRLLRPHKFAIIVSVNVLLLSFIEHALACVKSVNLFKAQFLQLKMDKLTNLLSYKYNYFTLTFSGEIIYICNIELRYPSYRLQLNVKKVLNS